MCAAGRRGQVVTGMHSKHEQALRRGVMCSVSQWGVLQLQLMACEWRWDEEVGRVVMHTNFLKQQQTPGGLKPAC